MHLENILIFIGNVYTVMACAGAIAPLISAPIVNIIYARTIEYFPGGVYFFGMSMDTTLIILLG